MINIIKKLFTKTPASDNQTSSSKPYTIEKIDYTPEKIQEFINNLTINLKTPSQNVSNENLKNSLSSEYDEVEIDEDTKQQILELKKITEDIDNRLLKTQPFSLDTNKYKISYEKELNKQQLAAVLEIENPLLVIAGAGSGKTRVITYKVSYLIESGITPSQILLLTFTRKSANEMLDRVQKLLGEKSMSGVQGGTFHAFSNNVLRKYGNIIGLSSNFTIIDLEDTTDIIDLLKTELNISGKKNGRPFPKKDKIVKIISKSRNLELSIEATIKKYYEENTEYAKEIGVLYQALNAYKKNSNLLDYDDLMTILRDKLKENTLFRTRLSESIKYILVDEYQDTNNTQREIIELLMGNKNHIMVVGDDAQSIYAFRGANFENILRFPQFFPTCKIVKVEENYRSEQGILHFTNEIIKNAKIGFKKELYSHRYTGRKPLIRRFADETQEAEFIVDKILEIRNNSLEYSNFAVLTRASWHSNYVQAELMKRNIPFIVVGGIKFSERRHVKDMIALLKLVLNPLDSVAWHRILQLSEGIGKVRAREIVTVIHKNFGKIDFSSFQGKSYYKELQPLENTFNSIDTNFAPALICDKFLSYYLPILQQVEDDFEVRRKDLDVFMTIVSKYDNLEKFLSEFVLEPPSNKYQDNNLPVTHIDEKPLIVSTIHSAKGLEWHTVFIPFSLDGLIPSVKSLGTIQELEEERRLFYVASSRAKENLFITMPSYISSWDSFFTKPSRFIAEINKEKYDVM